MDDDSDSQTPPSTPPVPNKQKCLQIPFTPTPPYLKSRKLNIAQRNEHLESLGLINTKKKLKKPKKPSMVLKGPLYNSKLLFFSVKHEKGILH